MSAIPRKRPKQCGNKCVVCGKSKFSHPGLKLFIFPRKDVERCEKWIISTGYFELKYLPLEAKRYVCELHFDEKDFMSVLKNRLMPNAIPKKSDIQHVLITNKPTSYYRTPFEEDHGHHGCKNGDEINSSPSESNKKSDSWNINSQHSSDSTEDIVCDKLNNFVTNRVSQVSHSKTNVEFVPMIQPYYKRNCRPVPCRHCKRKDKTIFALRKRIRELKRLSFKNRIDQLKNISKDSKIFAKMFLTHGKHRVWTEDEKTFAIDLLNKSSSAYYYLRHNKKLILPSKASVQSWIKERTKQSEQDLPILECNNQDNANANDKLILQPNEHLSGTRQISSIDTIMPLACAMEIPMPHPNDNILSIPNISDNVSHQMQTFTTLQPITTNLHDLSQSNQHIQTHIHTGENLYKQTYQIIAQEGINIKSAYIIHLNKT